MKTLIVVAGPNGSGKSSLRDALISPVADVIDPDRIAREINPSNPESVSREASVAAIKQFELSLREGRSISLETTLSGHSAVMRMRRAKAAGYDISLVYVALKDPELNVLRVAARVRQGGHAIEPDLIRRRVETSLGNLPIALSIANQAIVFDNSGRSHETMFEAAAGRVVYLAEQLPSWLETRMPSVIAALKASGAGAPGPTRPSGVPTALGSSMFDGLRRPGKPPELALSDSSEKLARRLADFEHRGDRSTIVPVTCAEPSLAGRKPSKGPGP